MTHTLKTRILNRLRKVLMYPPVEKRLASYTRGHDYDTLLGKITPNHYLYPAGTLREITRYGLRFEIDMSEIIGWYLYFGFVDPSIESFLALCRKGDVIIDVGANIGVTAMRSAQIAGAEGQVIALEPDPANFARCLHHLAINRVETVKVLNLAASDRDQDLSLQVRDPHNLGMNRVDPTGSSGTQVKAIPLDDLVNDHHLHHIDVIKIDVEGFECAVLEGATELIGRCHPRLFVELDDENLRYQGRSAAELMSLLKELGYHDIRDARTGAPASSLAPFQLVHTDVLCTAARG